jgi:hypothetical protein
MPNLIMNNLMFFIPMALAGLLLCGEVPVAKDGPYQFESSGRGLRRAVALLVLEALPVLI